MTKILLIFAIFCAANSLQADEVTVSGRKILVNGNRYLIKGVCYQPVPKGSNTRSWETLTQDLALMNEAGINTIRVYAPIDNEDVLDEIHEAGIKVIIGFGYNMNGYYDILSGTFIDYIKKFKDHDAILLWEFGNEYNYHPEWFSNDITNWYTALNNAANDAHFEDENHPTATAHGELPNAQALNACSNVDVWGLNIYRWDNPNAADNNLSEQWKNVSTKPMYLSEAGADRYMAATMNGYEEGENEQAQADATKRILESIFSRQDICSGVTVFEFCDEWWKAGSPSNHNIGGIAPFSSGVPYDATANEEYWGILDIERNRTAAFNELKTIYNATSVSILQPSNTPDIKIFPNPIKDKLYIKSAIALKQIYVYNMFGQLLNTTALNKNSTTINLSEFNSGTYMLLLAMENETTWAQKIMKE